MNGVALLGALGGWVLVRILMATHRGRDHVLFAVLLLAALTRVLIGILNNQVGPLPGAEVDAITYGEYARHIAQVFRAEGYFEFLVGRMGYSSLLAGFYVLGGYHYLIPTFVNLACFIEFLLLVYALAVRIGDRSVGRAVVILTAFYPTGLIYTSVALREAPLMFGLALYVTGLIDYYERKQPLANWKLLVGFVVMVWLHDGFALALGAVPFVAWFRYEDRPAWLRTAVILAAMGLVAVVFWQAGVLFRKLPSNPLTLADPAFLAALHEHKTSYGITYGHVQPTWTGVISSVPVLLYGFVASPFPVWAQGIGDLPKLAEGLYSLVLTMWALAATWGGRKDRRSTERLVLMAIFLVLLASFAMGTANTGIAARHRAKFIWLPITMIALTRPWRILRRRVRSNNWTLAART